MKPTPRLHHLAQLFRSPFLRKIAEDNHRKELVERLELCGLSELLSLPLQDILERIYQILLDQYRCEYVFKNAVTQNYAALLGCGPEGYITDEFRVGSSRVDLAVFASTSAAFEIKTEYDSTIRVQTQTDEYRKVFDLVYVVTTAAFRPKVEATVGASIGLVELRLDGTLNVVRRSENHATKSNLSTSFDCLRQSEMLQIAEGIARRKIDVPSSQIYAECRRHFRTVLPFEGHTLILDQLRARRNPSATSALLGDVLPSLKHAALTLRATRQQVEAIRKQLKSSVEPEPCKPKSKPSHAHLFPLPPRQAKRVDRPPRAIAPDRSEWFHLSNH